MTHQIPTADQVAAAYAQAKNLFDPDYTIAYFGTTVSNDEPAHTFDQRLTRCYELAVTAVLFGTAPEGSTVVHGTIHGHGAPRRIGHAWVVLPDGRVWEPIRAAVYAPEAWEVYARPEVHAEYGKAEAAGAAILSGHYGPWDE